MVDKQDENNPEQNISPSTDEQASSIQSNDTDTDQTEAQAATVDENQQVAAERTNGENLAEQKPSPSTGGQTSWSIQAATENVTQAESVESADSQTTTQSVNSESSSEQERSARDDGQSSNATSGESNNLQDNIPDFSNGNERSVTQPVAQENNQSANFTTLLNRKKKANVRPYDLKIKHNLIPERFAALEIINARFSRQFRVALFNRIRRNIDVIAHPIKQQTFREFSQEATASHLNLVNLHPLRGISLFLFSPELISLIVSNLFGSEGRFAPSTIEDREFTLTEQQVIKRILQLLLSIYQTSWADIYQVEAEYVRSEMQIRFTNITNSADDIVLTSEFTVEIDGFNCRFCICIPYDSVEQIKDLLVNPPTVQQSSHNDKEWRSSLTTGIKRSTVELVANFTKIDTTVDNVLALRINDILKIEKPDFLDVTIGGVPVLTGQFGKSNKQYAIQVEKLIGPALDQINEESLNDGRYRNKR